MKFITQKIQPEKGRKGLGKMVFRIRLMLTIGEVFLKFWKRMVCLIYGRF